MPNVRKFGFSRKAKVKKVDWQKLVAIILCLFFAYTILGWFCGSVEVKHTPVGDYTETAFPFTIGMCEGPLEVKDWIFDEMPMEAEDWMVERWREKREWLKSIGLRE